MLGTLLSASAWPAVKLYLLLAVLQVLASVLQASVVRDFALENTSFEFKFGNDHQ